MTEYVYIEKKFIQTIKGDRVTLYSDTNPQIYSNKTTTNVTPNRIDFGDGSYWDRFQGIYNPRPETYILVITYKKEERFSIKISGDYPLGKPVAEEAFRNRVANLPKSKA